MIEPKDSLEETLDSLNHKITDFQKNSQGKRASRLEGNDVLMIPEMFWEIDHHFKELIGKVITNANPPMPIAEARQEIKFKLDRYGAALESEALLVAFSTPRYLRFNRPFMLYIKKRDGEQPFFVMWVDNAELLNKK